MLNPFSWSGLWKQTSLFNYYASLNTALFISLISSSVSDLHKSSCRMRSCFFGKSMFNSHRKVWKNILISTGVTPFMWNNTTLCKRVITTSWSVKWCHWAQHFLFLLVNPCIYLFASQLLQNDLIHNQNSIDIRKFWRGAWLNYFL